jgi:Zn-finger nucleic acid-binding protein
MKCPPGPLGWCRSTMASSHRYPTCNGRWLDHELDHLEAIASTAADAESMREPAACLSGAAARQRSTRAYNLGGTCRQHGFWLDAGKTARARHH